MPGERSHSQAPEYTGQGRSEPGPLETSREKEFPRLPTPYASQILKSVRKYGRHSEGTSRPPAQPFFSALGYKKVHQVCISRQGNPPGRPRKKDLVHLLLRTTDYY